MFCDYAGFGFFNDCLFPKVRFVEGRGVFRLSLYESIK